MVPRSLRLLALVVLLPSLAWAGRRFELVSWADFCSSVCEFRLCLTAGERPSLRPCEDLSPTAPPGIVIRASAYPFLRLRLRGVTATALLPSGCALLPDFLRLGEGLWQRVELCP